MCIRDRATQGLLIHANYPITLDATTQINNDISGTRMMTITAGGVAIGTTTPNANALFHVLAHKAGHYDGAVQLNPTLSGNSNSGTGVTIAPTYTGVVSDNTAHFASRFRYTLNSNGNTQGLVRTLYIQSPVETAGSITSHWGLFIEAGSVATNNYGIYSSGKVGIGTQTPSQMLEVVGQVKITGGSPGADKVLTSDANGLATWEDAAGGGDTLSWADYVGL